MNLFMSSPEPKTIRLAANSIDASDASPSLVIPWQKLEFLA
jgi:hypothetical protein